MAAVGKGRCSRCGKHPAAPGQRWCAPCRRTTVAESKRRKANAWNRLARVARVIDPTVKNTAADIADVLVRTVELAARSEPELLERLREVGYD